VGPVGIEPTTCGLKGSPVQAKVDCATFKTRSIRRYRAKNADSLNYTGSTDRASETFSTCSSAIS